MAKGFAPVSPPTVSASVKKFKGTILDELKGFKEDRSRIRMGHGPENMTLLRRLCVNLIKRDKTKGSINMKRNPCGHE